MVVPTMHEKVHEWTRQNNEIREPAKQMRAMLDDQIDKRRGA